MKLCNDNIMIFIACLVIITYNSHGLLNSYAWIVAAMLPVIYCSIMWLVSEHGDVRCHYCLIKNFVFTILCRGTCLLGMSTNLFDVFISISNWKQPSCKKVCGARECCCELSLLTFLPSWPFLGCHFGFHTIFHNRGRTLFLQLGY